MKSLKMKFQKLISEEIIVKEGEDYRCICGSLLKEKTVYTHMKSKKHIQTKICNICYIYKYNFYNYHKCKNSHCMDCYLNMNSCPYCRNKYSNQENNRITPELNIEIVLNSEERRIFEELTGSERSNYIFRRLRDMDFPENNDGLGDLFTIVIRYI